MQVNEDSEYLNLILILTKLEAIVVLRNYQKDICISDNHLVKTANSQYLIDLIFQFLPIKWRDVLISAQRSITGKKPIAFFCHINSNHSFAYS